MSQVDRAADEARWWEGSWEEGSSKKSKRVEKIYHGAVYNELPVNTSLRVYCVMAISALLVSACEAFQYMSNCYWVHCSSEGVLMPSAFCIVW